MRWSKGGTMSSTGIFEAATLHQAMRAVCACGHSSTFWSAGLWWHFHQRGWDGSFAAVCDHFWCRRCASRLKRKVRPVRLEAVDPSACDALLPSPEEREWKRMLRRVR